MMQPHQHNLATLYNLTFYLFLRIVCDDVGHGHANSILFSDENFLFFFVSFEFIDFIKGKYVHFLCATIRMIFMA